MKRFSSGLLALGWLALQQPANADSMRCGDNLASSGDTTYEVRASCGEPDAADHHVEYRTIRQRIPIPCTKDANGRERCESVIEQTIEVVVDDWTYDFGKNRFIQHLRFEQGRLLSVVSGGYGHKDAT